MTLKTFSEWWQTQGLQTPEKRHLCISAWNACEESRPTFETLVAQLGGAETRIAEMRSVLETCDAVLSAIECGHAKPLATGVILDEVRALLK